MSIPVYKSLYQHTNANKKYIWSIKIEPSGNAYSILTEHGVVNGKLIKHKKEIKKGKANRSTLEQAILEATRKWKNKKEKDGYSLDLNKCTKQNIIVRPMLAHKFTFKSLTNKSRAVNIELPAYIQKKYDGIRCLTYLKNGNIVLESRKGTPFNNFNDIEKELSKFLVGLPDTFYLDGELYTDDIPFEEISGLVRQKEKILDSKESSDISKIKYYIYDCFDTNNLSMTYTERLELLSLFFSTEKWKFLVMAETTIVTSAESIKKFHDKVVKEGFEGVMLRNMNAPYEIKKRSKHLQKYKEIIEEEFKITGYHDGTGKEKGLVIWECITKDGKKFSVRPKGSHKLRKEWYQDADKYIGKQLTVIFQEYTGDGVPRFPVGKAIRDCY